MMRMMQRRVLTNNGAVHSKTCLVSLSHKAHLHVCAHELVVGGPSGLSVQHHVLHQLPRGVPRPERGPVEAVHLRAQAIGQGYTAARGQVGAHAPVAVQACMPQCGCQGPRPYCPRSLCREHRSCGFAEGVRTSMWSWRRVTGSVRVMLFVTLVHRTRGPMPPLEDDSLAGKQMRSSCNTHAEHSVLSGKLWEHNTSCWCPGHMQTARNAMVTSRPSRS